METINALIEEIRENEERNNSSDALDLRKILVDLLNDKNDPRFPYLGSEILATIALDSTHVNGILDAQKMFPDRKQIMLANVRKQLTEGLLQEHPKHRAVLYPGVSCLELHDALITHPDPAYGRFFHVQGSGSETVMYQKFGAKHPTPPSWLLIPPHEGLTSQLTERIREGGVLSDEVMEGYRLPSAAELCYILAVQASHRAPNEADCWQYYPTSDVYDDGSPVSLCMDPMRGVRFRRMTDGRMIDKLLLVKCIEQTEVNASRV